MVAKVMSQKQQENIFKNLLSKALDVVSGGGFVFRDKGSKARRDQTH